MASETKEVISQDDIPLQEKKPFLVIPDHPVDEEEEEARGNWTGKLDFLLSCLSYAVGLGNLWRFPYICFSNGGGAFLLPYCIMLIFTGIPLFLMELSFGQFGSSGIVSIWKVVPLFQGVGWAMFMVSAYIGVYYNMVIAWAVYYFISSCTSHLPWASCNNTWNSADCRDEEGSSKLLRYATIGNDSSMNATSALATKSLVSASHEYFHREVLDISDEFGTFGSFQWHLAGSLLLAWCLVALCLIKGIKSSGKAVYFTATFPYVVLTILLIRGVQLDGAGDGILYYVTPQWERLTKAKVWGDAAVQIFFSLSPCWGGLITLASYNKFHNNVMRDALVVSIGNCLTSIFAGFVVFSSIGHMSHTLQKPIEKVASSGPSLAFVIYPEMVSLLPISPLWSLLFFAMLITLGLGTQFAVVNTVHTTIVDIFPHFFHGKLNIFGWLPARMPSIKFAIERSTPLMLLLCVVGYLLGLIFCSQNGMYILQLFDTFAATYSVLLIGLTECLVLVYVYGIRNFVGDIRLMLGCRDTILWRIVWAWWTINWMAITPLILIFIIIFTWIDFTPSKYGDYPFPTYANVLGWVMSLSSVFAIPVCIAVKIFWAHRQDPMRPLIWTVKHLCRPTPEWGPAEEKYRAEYAISRNFGDRPVVFEPHPIPVDDVKYPPVVDSA